MCICFPVDCRYDWNTIFRIDIYIYIIIIYIYILRIWYALFILLEKTALFIQKLVLKCWQWETDDACRTTRYRFKRWICEEGQRNCEKSVPCLFIAFTISLLYRHRTSEFTFLFELQKCRMCINFYMSFFVFGTINLL